MENKFEFEEYCDEIYINLKTQESNRLLFKARSSHLNKRDDFVDDLIVVSTVFRLSTRIVHLAVHYFDYFLDENEVDGKDARLCALTSLVIAAKVDEKDSLIPTYNQMSEVSDFEFSSEQFINMERQIISALHWQLVFPTLITFVEYFDEYAISEIEISETIHFQFFISDIRQEMSDTIRFLCDSAIKDLTTLIGRVWQPLALHSQGGRLEFYPYGL